ncbi:MAG: glutathione S-transferase family protein [Gammaproteobacteria bacterium]|nr:glutathione S-transferase family protein [Gammaproteobacteria bacterium]
MRPDKTNPIRRVLLEIEQPGLSEMIRLYGNALSTYCAKVRVVLRYKDIPFEDCAPPDGYGSCAYRAIIPMGTIPGFVDGSVVLSESEAIAEYLEEQYAEPPLLFGDAAQRAHIRSLSRIHDCWVEPQLRALYAHVSPAARDRAVVSARGQTFNRRLRELSHYATPGPFIAGDRLSLADCAWATTLIQAELLFPNLGLNFAIPQPLHAWRAAIDSHPAIAPGVGPCADSMRAWLDRAGVSE